MFEDDGSHYKNIIVGLKTDLAGSGHEWVKLVVGYLLCSERFFSGFSGFPLSSKINITKFQLDWMQDLPGNYFKVNGAYWVNIDN